jgi:hypothetical protein
MSEHKQKRPTLGAGKISYLQIPAVDIGQSTESYEKAFGWNIRHRSDGTIAVDDGVNEVSGTWVLNRPPMREPGLLIYVMVANVADTADAMVRHVARLRNQLAPNRPTLLRDSVTPAEIFLGFLTMRSMTST